MSLQYVTRKLKIQTLADKENNDDPDERPLDDDQQSGSGLGMEGEESEEVSKAFGNEKSPSLSNPAAGCLDVPASVFGLIRQPAGDHLDDRYSSEEELKEIISSKKKRKKLSRVSRGGGGGGSGSCSQRASCFKPVGGLYCRSSTSSSTAESRSSSRTEIGGGGAKLGGGIGTNPETQKRKWSEVSDRGSSRCRSATISAPPAATARFFVRGTSGSTEPSGSRPCSSSGCSLHSVDQQDADLRSTSSVTRAVEISTPVQFCTSPPLDVHRPTRYIGRSPPHKLLHLQPKVFRHITPSPVAKPSARTRSNERDVVEKSRKHRRSLSHNNRLQQSRRHGGSRFNTPSPNRHQRCSSRVSRHRRNVQRRPCLDFEKMQQIKKRVVTSWRPQGGELSLFCW